jgi:hypothetical protein
MFTDSFSGALADLRKSERTEENALAVLAEHPQVSTWDMSEYAWLRGLIEGLESKGLIKEQDEPYPWLRYEITEAGKEQLAKRR